MNFNVRAKPPYPYLFAFGIFLVFVGVRMHFIMDYASQTPYWDDWGMGNRMAQYMESGFDPSWLYGLTNEHRAMFSKLTNLTLFRFNHFQWDPYLTMVLDVFLWGAIGVFMITLGFCERAKINPWLFGGLIVVLWIYPLSLFNTLSTIQTYLYYMMIFAMCGFWLITYKVFSFKWIVGVLFIASASMTTAGGSFAAVAVLSVCFFLALVSKQQRSQYLITAGFSGIFAVFGLYLIVVQGSSNPVGSKSLAPFLMTLFKTLSWPSSDRAWPSVIFLLPIIWLALGITLKKVPQSRLTTFTLMMAAFGIMLSTAIAYARGATGSGPAERYFDFLTIYLIASALSLMLIQSNSTKLQLVTTRSLAVLWVAMCLLAVPYHLKVSNFQLNDRAKLVPIQDDIMARYSVSNDPDIFKNRPFRHVPFPRASTLQDFMARLQRTDTLPYSLQASSMALDVSDNAFTLNGVAGPSANLYRGLEPILGSLNPEQGELNATGSYTSEVFTAKRPYVMLPVSGNLKADGISIALIGENNSRVTNVLSKKSSSKPNDRWQEFIVKAPDTQFRIVAEDNSTTAWLGFAAPRSVGQLSYYVDRIIQRGDDIWKFGLLLIILIIASQQVSFTGRSRTTA